MMRISTTRGWATLLCAMLLCAGTLSAQVNPKPFVVPEVKEWTGNEGTTTLSGRIVVKSSKLREVAHTLASDYEQLTGKPLTVASGAAKAGDIVLTLKGDKALGQEGYRMHIAQSVTLTASTPQGILWATRTLLQMAEQAQGKGLPKGTLADTPDYHLRGFMIDCGRKFIPMSYLSRQWRLSSTYWNTAFSPLSATYFMMRCSPASLSR